MSCIKTFAVGDAHAVVEISIDINDFSVKGSAALTHCRARYYGRALDDDSRSLVWSPRNLSWSVDMGHIKLLDLDLRHC